MDWRRPCIVLVALALGFAACTGEKSPLAVTTGADAFRAEQTLTGTFLDEPVAIRAEIHFRAPGDLSWFSDQQVGAQIAHIVIGEQAWTLAGVGGWRLSDPALVRDEVLGLIDAIPAQLASDRTQDLGPGPDVNGERTRRYRIPAPGFAKRVVAEISREQLTHPITPREAGVLRIAYERAESFAEIVLGLKSHRVYEVQSVANGPGLDIVRTTTFSAFNEPVPITPPR